MDYSELKRLAELATPGPWVGDRIDGTVKYSLLGANGNAVITGDNHNSGSGPYGIMTDEDERYLIVANPAAILSLLSDLEAANQRIKELEAANTINSRSAAEVVEACAKAVESIEPITRNGFSYHDNGNATIQRAAATIRALSPIQQGEVA